MPFVSSGQAENAAMLCSGGSGNVAANFDIELTSLAVSPVRGCPIVCRSQDILERHPDHRNLTIRQIERFHLFLGFDRGKQGRRRHWR
jgi:hypothetical protein